MEDNCFWIVLSGMGGELSREAVATEEEIGPKVAEIARRTPLQAGDTITIEEGWTEDLHDRE